MRRVAFRPAALALAVILSAAVLTVSAPPAKAWVSGTLWNAGNIISDQQFFDGDAMSTSQIQSFLNGKVPTCNTQWSSGPSDPIVCLKDYRQTTISRAADAYCPNAYVGASNESAATIISKVAAACNISPKVILVTLQKEQGLVTHTWPSAWRYDIAMGYGCPDTGTGCIDEYYGFQNQVWRAARQFQRYRLLPTSYNYRAGVTNRIGYHPNASCGTQSVYIQNSATAALYNYTPYVPNSAALAAIPGTGNACSSYGNRNFFMYYWEWFGDPSATVTVASTSPVSGTTDGGTLVTLTGTYFTGATSVTFGGVAGTSLSVINNGELTVKTPAHAAGVVNVVVTTPAGSSVAKTFTYVTPAPSVVTVSPTSGSTAGGTSVTLTGSHFTGATLVAFGGVAGTSLSVTHDGELTVKAPAHAVGPVDVVVTTPSGSSTVQTFTYVVPIGSPAPPDPASVSTVYRFWSPTNQSHFYTNSVAERDLILRTYPSSMWTYEGGTYNAFSSQQPGTVPLYRFWSAKFKGHFFTTSEAEKDQVIAIYDDATWLFEGVSYHVYPVDPAYAGTVTVARFWSQDNKHHFYTANAAERDHVIATYPAHEWAFEQNAFRVPSTPVVDAPLP